MSKPPKDIAAYTVHHRIPVILLLLAITGLATVGYVNPQLLTHSLFPSHKEGVAEAPRIGRKTPASGNGDNSPISLSGSDAVLVVQSDNFFTSDTVSALREVARRLEALDQVQGILWLDRVPILNIFGLPEPILPRGTASENRFEAARKKANQHPLVAGQLLSDEGTTLLMLITFDYYHVLDNSDATTLLRETASKALEDFPDVDLTFSVTGRMPTAIASLEAHEANLLKYQIIGYSMILIMSILLFRGLRAVIVVSLAPVVGVFWSLGCIRFLGYDNNPLVDVILPILVSLVGLTDGVHLMVQIRKLRAEGCDRFEAASRGLKQVGFACFLTSLTTAIGFGSLTLASSRFVQEFGVCCTLGVTLCFISVVTVIPLASTSWLGKNIHSGLQKSLVDRNLSRIGGMIAWILVHRRAMSAIAVISTVVFGAVSLTLTPDQRQSDNLPRGMEATEALFLVDEEFGGLEFSRIEIRWPDSVPSDSPEVLEVVSAVDDLLQGEKLIGHPLSIRNLIDSQPGSGPPAERMTMVELLPPPLKRAFYRPDNNEATVTFRVKDLGIAAYAEVFKRIEKRLAELEVEHAGFTLALDGNAVWRWRNLYQIVVDLAASLGTASLIILVVLAIVFRSIRLGMISVIPNLFPLAFTGAYLAFAGYNLEIVMVCNFTVCLGIAVDDTIHFLTRYLEESEKTDDTQEAIQRAFTGVGTALIMTTTVLVAGFSVVTFSDSREQYIFATMGALTISAALFCDLLFLPALLAVFARKKKASDA